MEIEKPKVLRYYLARYDMRRKMRRQVNKKQKKNFPTFCREVYNFRGDYHMLINEALNRFEKDCTLKGLKPKTIKSYREHLGYFIDATQITTLQEITPEVIEMYMLDLHGRPISKATVGTYLRPLRIFLRFLESKNHLDPDAGCSDTIKIPKTPVRKVDILSSAQLQQMFGGINTADALSVRDALILALMVDSGLRRKEVITLMVKNINLSSGTMKVFGKGDKERIVPVGKYTSQLIRLYKNLTAKCRNTPAAKQYLLLDRYYEPLTENAVKLMIQRKREDLGVDFSAHKLRHNFATNYCLDEYERTGCMDIYKLQAIMGHNNIETTMVYMHLAQEIIAATTTVSHLDQIALKL